MLVLSIIGKIAITSYSTLIMFSGVTENKCNQITYSMSSAGAEIIRQEFIPTGNGTGNCAVVLPTLTGKPAVYK